MILIPHVWQIHQLSGMQRKQKKRNRTDFHLVYAKYLPVDNGRKTAKTTVVFAVCDTFEAEGAAFYELLMWHNCPFIYWDTKN